LGGPVVPKRNGVRLPFQAHLILRVTGLIHQILQQEMSAALQLGHATEKAGFDVIGQMGSPAADIQNPLASFWMSAHHRVCLRWKTISQRSSVLLGDTVYETGQ